MGILNELLDRWECGERIVLECVDEERFIDLESFNSIILSQGELVVKDIIELDVYDTSYYKIVFEGDLGEGWNGVFQEELKYFRIKE